MGTRRILLLTFYYQPDLSAGTFRTAALVEALLQAPLPGVKIDVITTQPHRYSSYRSLAPEHEADEQVTIRRIKLPSHQSGMIDQGKAFAHFARKASRLSREHAYDLVLATSGRLMTAVLGAWIARRLNTPLYLDIRDIFVENLQFLLSKPLVPPFQLLFSAIERWTINRAVHVNVVSRGFEPYFQARYPEQSLSYFTNGVDDEFCLEPPETGPSRGAPDQPITVLYAGNIGEAQGLDTIIPAVARRLGGRVKFRIIGDGGRCRLLEQVLTRSGLGNVKIVPPMSRDALVKEYLAADVLFLHLNNYDSFKKVLPSKIFEYAALGKPIWAGVTGYCATFIHQEICNAAVFPPCNVEEALTAFQRLKLRDAPRAAFVQKFSRRVIMRAMAADVLAHAASGAVS